jgi:hypothetical protein
MGFRLIIFGPADSVLVAQGAGLTLPGGDGPCHRSVALLRGKSLAAVLLRRAPEVWAAVLPSDGRGAAGALFHALVACAPGDDAPEGYRWVSPDVLASALPHTAQWLAAARDALAAVRALPASMVQARLREASCAATVPMTQLVRDAEQANTLLREHCEHIPGPAWQPNLFKSWGRRVPSVGIPADVGATSCCAQLALSEGAAHLPYRFNSDKYRPPRTVAAPPDPQAAI